MKVSTKGRYALRVMIDIASFGKERYVSLSEISKRQNITVKYLEQIISALVKARYLESLRGKSGGYRLSGKPSDYAVGDILRTAEGSLAPVACLEEDFEACPNKDNCKTRVFWDGLNRTLNSYIDSVTLEDLMN